MNNKQTLPYLKLLGDRHETKRGFSTVTGADKTSSRAINHKGKNWAHDRNWSCTSWVMFSARRVFFVDSRVRLSQEGVWVKGQPTQNRPLKPRIDAVNGAEAANGPNLREENRISASMAEQRGTVSVSFEPRPSVNRPSSAQRSLP